MNRYQPEDNDNHLRNLLIAMLANVESVTEDARRDEMRRRVFENVSAALNVMNEYDNGKSLKFVHLM